MAPYIIILIGGVLATRVGAADAPKTPLETMADVTNDFGFCVLQILATSDGNTVFSPYGLMSMALLVYEGSAGAAAAELYNSLRLPWHRDLVRIGFRDLHRYLRSYFSSEGFLKGLVLSKANVPLKPSYVEVLRFYGFQPDTSSTYQPATTQPVESKDKDSNETITTNTPETTTKLVLTTTPRAPTKKPSTPKTTVTTKFKPKPTTTSAPTKKPSTPKTTVTTKSKPTSTTTKPTTTTTKKPPQAQTKKTTTTPRPTTIKTTKAPAKPAATTTTLKTTTMPTTTVSETTTKEATTTESLQTTVTEMTSETTQKTTKETEVTKEVDATPKGSDSTQETETTTDMDVVTMTVPTMPEPESMNMVLAKPSKSDESSTELQQMSVLTTKNSEENVFRLTTLDSEMVETQETSNYDDSTTQSDMFSDEQGLADTMVLKTMMRPLDTTIPAEEVVILTTPFDDEIMTSEGMSMLEAIILAEDESSQAEYVESTTQNTVNKRSTYLQPEMLTTQPSILFTILLNTDKQNYKATTYDSEDSDSNVDISLEDGLSTVTAVNSLYELESDNNIEGSSSIYSESTVPVTSSYKEVDVNISSQYEQFTTLDSENTLPTLEPDLIIFPTLRLPRAVLTEEPSQAPLGNWVGTSPWQPGSNSQWFRTSGGDKPVPVLTYTAYLPYADLPSLSASAVQLPLDDPRYSLMILLPKSTLGLKKMIHTLQWNSLRNILKSFKPTPVYAVVPTFTIVQHINLTPVLFKLGIKKIFDAYQANLCELSSEPNLYVRSVEQVITISVQKYFTFHKWFEATQSQVEQQFLALHPFAYLVVDVETGVALVAGTITDPS